MEHDDPDDTEGAQLKESYLADPHGTSFRTGVRMIFVGARLKDAALQQYGNSVVDRFRARPRDQPERIAPPYT